MSTLAQVIRRRPRTWCTCGACTCQRTNARALQLQGRHLALSGATCLSRFISFHLTTISQKIPSDQRFLCLEACLEAVRSTPDTWSLESPCPVCLALGGTRTGTSGHATFTGPVGHLRSLSAARVVAVVPSRQPTRSLDARPPARSQIVKTTALP
eukprot:1195069-Prymnesium_polylepis.1